MNKLIDRFIELFKWPLAVYMLLSLPACIQFIRAYRYSGADVFLLAGFIFFFFCRTMMDSNMKQSMEVVAHELTHTIFAMLTLHKVKSIRVNPDDSGGAMAFEGKGNWLITIAPYFFPLFGVIVMLGITVYLRVAPATNLLGGILGFFIGYHLDTVASQIHDKQTDLTDVSYKFCVMFLPAANLMAIESMLVFNRWGWKGVWHYFSSMHDKTIYNLHYAYNFILSVF
ncbi:MAG: M50 family metallopeptidase [Alphaproteobacteria bacterium]|nr:M50 family metallopeptidase [Alphaproteobacteria bacterium]